MLRHGEQEEKAALNLVVPPPPVPPLAAIREQLDLVYRQPPERAAEIVLFQPNHELQLEFNEDPDTKSWTVVDKKSDVEITLFQPAKARVSFEGERILYVPDNDFWGLEALQFVLRHGEQEEKAALNLVVPPPASVVAASKRTVIKRNFNGDCDLARENTKGADHRLSYFFVSDSVRFTAETARKNPQLLNSMMQAVPGQNAHILVFGHADASAGARYNIGLSHQRATKVRDLVISNAGGYDVFLCPFGEGNPDRVGPVRFSDRRVDVVFFHSLP